jgi:excisionase family DNA binding protein
MNPLTKPLMSAREVAEYLGVGLRTVWRWNAKGRLPAPMRHGRVVRWKRTEVEDFVKNSPVKRLTEHPAAPPIAPRRGKGVTTGGNRENRGDLPAKAGTPTPPFPLFPPVQIRLVNSVPPVGSLPLNWFLAFEFSPGCSGPFCLIRFAVVTIVNNARENGVAREVREWERGRHGSGSAPHPILSAWKSAHCRPW